MCGETMSTPPVVALYGTNQADVALLNQVEQCQPPPNVALGNAHHQPQIRQNELLHSLAVAHFNAFCQFDFALMRNHWNASNFAKVRHDRILLASISSIDRVLIIFRSAPAHMSS